MAIPTMTARIAFSSNPFAASPTWSDVSTYLRSHSIRRGRQHELDRIEAGTATIVLDNNLGHFWPDNASGDYYPNVLPGKRLNIRATYNAVTYDRFTGFIESYQHDNLRGIPVVTITAVDLFKHLALTKLNDVVADFAPNNHLYINDNAALSMGDIDFTITTWVHLDNVSSTHALIGKTTDASNYEYELYLNSATGQFGFAMSSTGAVADYNSVNNTTSISASTWYFLAAQYDATNNLIKLSVNAGTAATQAYSGGAADGTSVFRLGQSTYSSVGAAQQNLDGRMGPTGVWKRLLSSDDITTAYNQGRRTKYADLSASLKSSMVAWWDMDESSGTRSDSYSTNNLTVSGSVGSVSQFPSERSDQRVGRVLDLIGWPSANRDLDTGSATLQATTVSDLNALSHLQSVARSEGGLVFIAPDGDVQFKARYHRIGTASDATFGDDAGEMNYYDLVPSYDDTFIFNDVRCTRTGGTEQVAGDVDSQSKYGKRTLTRSDLLQSADGDVLTLAESLKETYKAPSLRIASIIIDPARDEANLWPKVLNYDISTRITVRLNDASLDKEFLIEGIAEQSTQNHIWQTVWQLGQEEVMAYTDWTPTVTQSGAVTVTVSEAKYALVGKVCHIYCRLLVTGTGTGNNVIIVGGIPAAANMALTTADSCFGAAVLLDSGSAWYQGGVVPNSASAVKFMRDGGSNYMGVDPNFALANNDTISFSLTYRVA